MKTEEQIKHFMDTVLLYPTLPTRAKKIIQTTLLWVLDAELNEIQNIVFDEEL